MTLGVLGGTFDPLHNGHLAAATAAQQHLEIDSVVLVPSRIPPHRQDPVGAGAEHRYEMARLAAAERPGWSTSRVEIDREGPSYTYDTLVELRRDSSIRLTPSAKATVVEKPDTTASSTQFFFILGADAFAEIATWFRYPAVLDLANFVVVSRPGITLDSLRERVPSAFDRQPPCPPSSLRDLGREETRVILVESNTPDISSTDIRRRVRAGLPLSGLVPDTVAEYIRAHRLYVGH
jgi:nicotinate-nucleotide adenylyltransferase